MAGGGGVSVVGKAATTACKRENREGEKEEELTGSWPVQTTGPGKRRWWQIDGEDPRRPARGENVGGGVPGLFWSRETTRRTREDLRSSGRRRGGERSTVAAAIGVGGGGGSRVRGRESRGRRGGRGRVRAVRGSCVASSGASRESGEAGGGQQGGGGARACRRASGTRPRPSVRGGRRQKAAGGGLAASWRWAR